MDVKLHHLSISISLPLSAKRLGRATVGHPHDKGKTSRCDNVDTVAERVARRLRRLVRCSRHVRHLSVRHTAAVRRRRSVVESRPRS